MRKGLPLWLIFIVATTLVPHSAWAAGTVRYVSTTGSDANNCTAAQNIATPKLTINSAIACMAAGDITYVRAGTYTDGMIGLPAGVSASVPSVLQAYQDEDVIIRPNSGLRVIYASARSYLKYWNLEIDGQNVTIESVKVDTGSNYFVIGGDMTAAGAFRCKIHNSPNIGISIQGTPVDNGTITGCDVYDSGLLATTSPYAHGMYLQRGVNWTITKNRFRRNGCYGFQANGSTHPVNLFFSRNLVYDNARTPGCGIQAVFNGTGHTVEYSAFWNDLESGNTEGIRVEADNTTLRHLTLYNAGSNTGVRFTANASGSTLQNSVILGSTTAIVDGGVGSTLTDNLTSGTASTIFTSVTTGAIDLSLKAGSVAIDGGTTIGLASCGTNPDQGAFERPVVTAASVSGNVMLVTICNVAPPIIPGTFTVARSGGTPTVLSTSLQGGSGGIVRLEVSETCAAAQTWTVSGGTSTTDSALIGNQFNQPLHTTTNFAVDSSACDGTGGPSAPAGEVAHYEFENDLTDSSGNGNTATSSNVTFTTGRSGQGVLTTVGVDSHIDTGLLSGHNPSTTHLVVAAWFYIDPADLGQTKDLWGTAVGTNQQFVFYRHSGNTYRMLINGMGGTASEFPVVSGWTHGCIKMNPTGDIATMYINGVAGVTSGASVITYGSYTLASDLNFGLPSGFATNLSGAHILDDAYIYTTDVSCTDLYNAGQPESETPMSVQATHQWQGVFTASGGSAENRGAADAQRTVVKGGAGALMVQLNNTSGASVILQPRFRYNINGGSFTNVVPDSPTADGVSYWGASLPSGLNNGLADGPISGALAHTDGLTLTTSSAIPTITMANNTSYTMRGIFYVDAAVGDVVCFKVYDQGGSALASYAPSEGACLTVISTQASGGY